MTMEQTIYAIRNAVHDNTILSSKNFGTVQLINYKLYTKNLQDAISNIFNDPYQNSVELEQMLVKAYVEFAYFFGFKVKHKGVDVNVDQRFRWSKQLRDLLITNCFKCTIINNHRTYIDISNYTFRKRLESLILNIYDGKEGYIITPEDKAKRHAENRKAKKATE